MSEMNEHIYVMNNIILITSLREKDSTMEEEKEQEQAIRT